MHYKHFNNHEYETHMIVYHEIASRTKVLDLGCATGYFGKKLNDNKSCEVTGVEKENIVSESVKNIYHRVVLGDLENPQNFKIPRKYFDYILLMDVVEHLLHREQLLKNIKTWLKPTGELIISTPNIAHLSVRWNLAFGNFDYTEYGILDKNHVHFFNKKSLLNLLLNCGFNIKEVKCSADFGQLPFIGRYARHLPKFVQYQISQRFQTLLGVQFIVFANNYRI